MGKEVIFYYDVVCPFAYMASQYVERLAQRTQATVHWRPVLLGEPEGRAILLCMNEDVMLCCRRPVRGYQRCSGKVWFIY